MWDHTVLPATSQRWLSRLYPSRSWYSIQRPRRDATLSWPRWWLHTKIVYLPKTVTYLRNNQAVSWSGLEPATRRSHVQRPNHYTTEPPCVYHSPALHTLPGFGRRLFLLTTRSSIDTVHYTEKSNEVVMLWDLFACCFPELKAKGKGNDIAVRNQNHHTTAGNHMPKRSHSVTCHPAAVTFPTLPQPKLVLDLATLQGCKAELTRVVVIFQDSLPG